MTNGMPIIVNGVMKPIPTLYKPLNSVDINTKEDFKATIERSDSCAVPAASVVCEHVVAFEVAKAITEEFQSNHIDQLKPKLMNEDALILNSSKILGKERGISYAITNNLSK